MHVYQLDIGNGGGQFYADRAALQAAIKFIPPSGRIEVEVTLLDVSVAKADVVFLLNGHLRVTTTLRRWRLSHRGGLIEETL